MDWRTRILLTLVLSGLLIAQSPGATGGDAPELASRVKNHINERMYNTCKTVVLQREDDNLYTGHAEFLNGIKVGLELTVSDERMEYAFVRPPREPSGIESAQTQIEQLQEIITRQDIEIARLRDLCAHAGIDVDAIETNAVLISDEELAPLPEPADAQRAEPSPAPPSAAPEAESVWFTRPSYDQVNKGMPFDRVCKVLGAEGKLISNSDFDRAVNEVYIWANADDSHACVVFRNGKVLVKTQFGLPNAAPASETPVQDSP